MMCRRRSWTTEDVDSDRFIMQVKTVQLITCERGLLPRVGGPMINHRSTTASDGGGDQIGPTGTRKLVFSAVLGRDDDFALNR